MKNKIEKMYYETASFNGRWGAQSWTLYNNFSNHQIERKLKNGSWVVVTVELNDKYPPVFYGLE